MTHGSPTALLKKDLLGIFIIELPMHSMQHQLHKTELNVIQTSCEKIFQLWSLFIMGLFIEKFPIIPTK